MSPFDIEPTTEDLVQWMVEHFLGHTSGRPDDMAENCWECDATREIRQWDEEAWTLHQVYLDGEYALLDA
jgi:hypothetical protein